MSAGWTPHEGAVLLEALAILSRRFARDTAAELKPNTRRWISQKDTVYGNRTHVGWVKGRIARGEDGACVKGKLYLLSPEAQEEELQRAGRRPAEEDASLSKLAAECGIRLIGGGRR